MKGKVRWFNSRRGYGFIGREDSEGRDLFVHYSGIGMEGFKTLKSGQVVEFDIVEGPKGEQAGNIKILEEPEPKKPQKTNEEI